MNHAMDEAEIFAIELLMPRNMIYRECLKLAEAEIPRSTWPEWIGRLFGVPQDKAFKRLNELKI